MRFIHLCSLIIALTCACSDGGGVAPQRDTFTISGRLLAASGSLVDSDVNDPNADYRSNNSIDSAQPIYAPISFGGFLGTAAATKSGRFAQSGDEVDVFAVDLLAGQSIYLRFESAAFDDIDVYLMRSANDTVEAGISGGNSEFLTVTESGRYYLWLQTEGAATSTPYVLTIGEFNTIPSGTRRASDDFVPGSVVVMPAANKAASAFSQRPTQRAQRWGVRHAGTRTRWHDAAIRRRSARPKTTRLSTASTPCVT